MDREKDEETNTATVSCLVLHPNLRIVSNGRADSNYSRTPERCLEESVCLAESIDLNVYRSEIIALISPRPATLFGSGKVRSLAKYIASEKIQLVIVGGNLSPVQQRNLERTWKTKVIGRTALILEIFGARALTKEGKLQVELAALNYQRSRLVRSWTHLERQRGGYGFMGGPGESQIETDRRLIDNRISKLKMLLKEVRRTRGLHRKSRERVPYPIVALVGYTNAGKSSLFNALSNANVVSKDQLFATLDPTMRSITLPSGKIVILSDTVGFVSELPYELIEAFRATLEEVQVADLILHVRDIAHIDTDVQGKDVKEVLKSLGVNCDNGLESFTSTPLFEVLNKVDLLSFSKRNALKVRAKRKTKETYIVSATERQGLEGLLKGIDVTLTKRRKEIAIILDWEEGTLLTWLYNHGEVIERTDNGHSVELKVLLDPEDIARLKRKKRFSE